MTRLRTLLDSLDDLPDSIDPRSLYSEGSGADEGRYVLDLDAVDGLELARTADLAKALDKEKRGHRSQRSERAKLDERIAELQSELEEMKAAGNGADVSEALQREREKYEAKLQSAQQDRQGDFEALQKAHDEYRDQFRQQHVRNEIETARRSAGFEFPDAVLDILANHARWEEEDGAAHMSVLDTDRTTPLMKAGQAAGFDELLQRLSRDPQWEDIIRTKAPSGGGRRGAPPAQNPRQGGPRDYHASLDEMRDYSTYEQLNERHQKGEINLIPPTQGEG